MIEVTIKNYLSSNLNDIPVLFEKPKEKPEEYVIISTLDGGMVDHVPASTLSFIVGAKSYYKARVLEGRVKQLLNNSIELESVSLAKIGGESGKTVADQQTYEYTLIYNFYHYEED